VTAPFQLVGTYRPQLDGVRAMAVAAVVASHAAIPGAAEGGRGVDVFFVLSGFLITSLLVEEHSRSGSIDLRSFYAKRWRRLMPALAAMCLIALPLFALVRPFEYRATLAGVPAALAYVSAWVRATDTSSLGWLGHTWSLSVEEVFYLVWPAVIVLVARIRGRISARFLLLCLAVAVAYRSAAVMLDVSPSWLYNAPDMRAEQLMAGCALAGAIHQPGLLTWLADRPWFVRMVGTAGGAYVVAVLLGAPGVPDWYATGSTVLALSTALLILWLVLLPCDASSRLLGASPLRWIGVRSYGIYLWHLPLFGLFALKDETTAVRAAGRLVALGLTMVAAEVSLRMLEGGARRREQRPQALPHAI
jgi:peptidoglycan/LPS O-acetylase OafA/YrhL